MKLGMVALALTLAWNGAALAQIRIDPVPVTPVMPTPVIPAPVMPAPVVPSLPISPPPPIDPPRVVVPAVPPCRDVPVSERDAVTGAVTTHIERICN